MDSLPTEAHSHVMRISLRPKTVSPKSDCPRHGMVALTGHRLTSCGVGFALIGKAQMSNRKTVSKAVKPASKPALIFEGWIEGKRSNDPYFSVAIDRDDHLFVNEKQVSIADAAREFSKNWGKHYDGTWGKDEDVERFFSLLAANQPPSTEVIRKGERIAVKVRGKLVGFAEGYCMAFFPVLGSTIKEAMEATGLSAQDVAVAAIAVSDA